MAYADQSMSSGRVVAIIIVALLHAVLGYAFVTGLAYNVVKKVATDMDVFDVQDEPPPPEEEPPPPPPDKPLPPPPVVSPPPIVQTNLAPTPQIQVQREAPPVFKPTPVAAPPPPPPPRIAVPLKAKGNPQNWVTNDDYPASSIRNEEQGTTGFRLDVGTDGKVTNCTVTSSSGSSALDQQTCKLLMRRARFSPAQDSSGSPIAAGYTSRMRWQIPKD